jgi:hypothetical protein
LKQKREYKGGRTKKVVQKNNEANEERRTRNKGQIREDKVRRTRKNGTY